MSVRNATVPLVPRAPAAHHPRMARALALTMLCCLSALGAAACGGGSGGNPTPSDFPLPAATGLATRPPIGWNSWNKFNCNINATFVQGVADAIVASGMKDAGYQYINIDDCWSL